MRLKLPHLEPIRFAQDLVSRVDNTCIVNASFPYLPSLPMIIEAAAQSSAAYAKGDHNKESIAFLVMLKDITLLKAPNTSNLQITLDITQDMGSIVYFSFIAKDNQESIAEGSFAIAIQN
jgi:hypothetical protein